MAFIRSRFLLYLKSYFKIVFLITLILIAYYKFFFINLKVRAETLSISVSVYICGNNIIEGEEFCDDGENNGKYAFKITERHCNFNCTGWAAYCGDKIKQIEYGEQCDDGNNNNGDGCSAICELEALPSTTTTILGGGGGGGGGGGIYLPPETKIIFIGRAYPKSTVTLLKDAQVVATTIADEGALFKITLTKIPAGNYIFSLYSEDEYGNRSSLLTFPLSVTANVTTEVNNIFIAPTIDVDKSEVRKGDNIVIFGKSSPNSDITIIIHSEEEFYAKTKSDKTGAYLYKFDTTPLEYGEHYTKSKSSFEEEISSFSKTVSFKVSNINIFKKKEIKVIKGDFNSDKKVNLIDFSIMAYWYRRKNPPSYIDLNNDGKVDIKDFSILAYYWTG